MLIIFIKYITSLVLTYNWKFVPFDYLHLIPFPPPPSLIAANLVSFFMSSFTCLCVFWSITDLQYYVSLWYITQKSDIYIYFKIINISLVVICHHTKWSQYYRPYSPCETFHPHHHSFFFVTRSLYLLISFTYFTHSLDPSSGSHLIFLCIYEASLTAQLVKNLPAVQKTPVRFLGQEDLLEKG